MSLSEQLKNAMKDAMRAKEKQRLGTIRMALAAIKQIEIDERITLDDEAITKVITKMVKQRKDAIKLFREGDRNDLADNEAAEIKVLEDFLPQGLSESEIAALIEQAITDLNAAGMKDMGKVMGVLKPQMLGRADMTVVSGIIKARLNA
ncbi:MAG: hypothetical protein ACI8WB_003841 [Phenylobacterium sp.]|jgi:uncharacterized protein YqeY